MSELTETQSKVVDCLWRAQATLSLLGDSLHEGVKVRDSDAIVDAIQNELNTICGLVTGDLTVKNYGEVCSHKEPPPAPTNT